MYVYPDPPIEPTCVLLFIPVELVPIVGALFGRLERRTEWATVLDWQLGYKAFVDLQEQLMNNCLRELIDELRAARGVLPEYEDVPIVDRTVDMFRSLNDVLAGLLLLRGVVQGETLATLADLVLALRGVDAPADHVLMALRGETESDSERNVVELLS
jgi:hypothetical protein